MQNNRRDFFATSLRILPWALTVSMAYPAGKLIFFKEETRGSIAIPIKQLKEGITAFLPQNIYVYKQDEQIKVFDAHCTHMGCIIHFDTQNHLFNCPCHKSRFDIDGTKLRGPAKRDLDTISYTVKNKILQIG